VENATALAESLRSGGFQPRIVRLADDGLTRVRIGRFRIRDGAEALRRTLQAAGFEATIVTDAHAEERVR
jgi:cell division protein FtsN